MSPLKKNKHIDEIKSPEEDNSNNQLIKSDINSTKPVVDVHLHTFLINQVSCFNNNVSLDKLLDDNFTHVKMPIC